MTSIRLPHPDNQTDAYLWKAFAACNDRALESLFDQHFGRLILTIEGVTNNKELAEDIVYDVFRGVLEKKREKLYTGEEVENFFLWIRRHCINKWRSDLRRDKNRRNILEALGKEKTEWTLIDSELSAEQILECIESLSRPEHKTIISLVIQGYSNQEIDSQLNKPANFTKREKNRARKELKNILRERGLL
ncbi:MAG: sigma-70 family RNA polymerase sigma factor [Bacteroidota bacterium]